MFHLKSNNIKIVQFIFISMILNNFLLAESIQYKFKFIKLLEHGKKEVFKPEKENIKIEHYELKKDTKSKTSYPFYIEVEKKDVGKRIKLTIINEKDWIIVFPKNGEFIVPKMIEKNPTIKMNIKMIRKYTEIYFDIFGKYEYAVQVLYTKNKDIALQTINDLIKDNYDAYYEAVPIIPHRGYMYKVKVGHYHDLEKAKKKKIEIINRYSSFKDSFVTARLQDE